MLRAISYAKAMPVGYGADFSAGMRGAQRLLEDSGEPGNVEVLHAFIQGDFQSQIVW